ncbi:hypothetical protein MRY87_05200 [bacterium]|nr:hypothetical protein [bacterium]
MSTKSHRNEQVLEWLKEALSSGDPVQRTELREELAELLSCRFDSSPPESEFPALTKFSTAPSPEEGARTPLLFTQQKVGAAKAARIFANVRKRYPDTSKALGVELAPEVLAGEKNILEIALSGEGHLTFTKDITLETHRTQDGESLCTPTNGILPVEHQGETIYLGFFKRRDSKHEPWRLEAAAPSLQSSDFILNELFSAPNAKEISSVIVREDNWCSLSRPSGEILELAPRAFGEALNIRLESLLNSVKGDSGMKRFAHISAAEGSTKELIYSWMVSASREVPTVICDSLDLEHIQDSFSQLTEFGYGILFIPPMATDHYTFPHAKKALRLIQDLFSHLPSDSQILVAFFPDFDPRTAERIYKQKRGSLTDFIHVPPAGQSLRREIIGRYPELAQLDEELSEYFLNFVMLFPPLFLNVFCSHLSSYIALQGEQPTSREELKKGITAVRNSFTEEELKILPEGEIPFLFDCALHKLAEQDDRTIQAVLGRVPRGQLVLSMMSADDDFLRAIYRNISERAREIVKDELETQKPVRLDDVVRAKRALIETIIQLEAEGIITWGSSWSSEQLNA